MSDKVWTKDEIKSRLAVSTIWLERGILAVYDKQTLFEQEAEDTTENNKMGFSSFDAGYLSYVAKYLKNGKHLSGHHVEKARKRMLKYSGQLAKIANGEIT